MTYTNAEGITPPFFSSPSITRQRATQYCYATGRPRVRRLPTSPPPVAATEEAPPEPWLAGTSRRGGGEGWRVWRHCSTHSEWRHMSRDTMI